VWGHRKQTQQNVRLYEDSSKLKHEVHHVVEKQYLHYLFGLIKGNPRLDEIPGINLIKTVNDASATEVAEKAARLGRQIPFHITPAKHFPSGAAPGPHLEKGLKTRLEEICMEASGLSWTEIRNPPRQIEFSEKQAFIDPVANMLQNEVPYKGLNAWGATGTWMKSQPEFAGFSFPGIH
jgi:hypothetical protein